MNRYIAAVCILFASVTLVACSGFGDYFAEAKASAADARESAARAEEYAQASGDPEAIRLAREAKEQAAAVDAQLADLESKALRWAEAAESGEFGQAEGSEIGGLVGGLAGPQWGALGTLVGGVVGGLWYRRRAVQIIRAIDAGKAANPELDDAFGNEEARKAISRNLSPSTWKFVEYHRE